jgi:hypothetical protein
LKLPQLLASEIGCCMAWLCHVRSNGSLQAPLLLMFMQHIQHPLVVLACFIGVLVVQNLSSKPEFGYPACAAAECVTGVEGALNRGDARSHASCCILLRNAMFLYVLNMAMCSSAD